MKSTHFLDMARDIGSWWVERNVGLMAGAIAFFSMLSLAPLLAFTISVSGFFAQTALKNQLVSTVSEMFGQETADFLFGVITAAFRLDGSGSLLATAGLVVMLFFASTVFNSLKLALNAIWDVRVENRPHSGILALLWNRLLASAMVILTSTALVLTMLAGVIGHYMQVRLTHRWPELADLVSIYRLGVVTGVPLIAGLMMVAYKVLPDVPLTWRQVMPGALLVTLLFMLGNELMEVYFSLSALPTVYGAAGSLVIVLLWVYFSSHIFFLGALFTRTYVRHLQR